MMVMMMRRLLVVVMLMSQADDNNNGKYVKFSDYHAELTDNFFPMADNDFEY